MIWVFQTNYSALFSDSLGIGEVNARLEAKEGPVLGGCFLVFWVFWFWVVRVSFGV